MTILLDRVGRDGVEGRARLVHQQHLRGDGDRAGDAETLLLAAREAGARTVEAVLDLVPQVRAGEGLLDEVVLLALRHALVVELHPGEHVLLDRHRGERVRPLEHHADLATHEHRVDAGAVEVLAVEQHLALDAGAGDHLVHAVESAEEGGLAAARRADEGRDAARLDVEGDAFDREEVAVVDVEVVDFDALGHLRDQAGEQVQHHDDEDEGEGGGPGARDGGVRARALVHVLVVGEHREGHHLAVEDVRVEALREAGGEQQRGGLADHAGDGEHDRGHDAGDRGGQDDLEDREPLRHAQSVGGLAQLVRDDPEQLLAAAHHDRRHQHGEGESAHEAHRDAGTDQEGEHRVDEQTGDDRGDARHHVDEERDGLGDLAAAVLDEVDRGHQTDRHGDDRGRQRDEDRAPDGVHDTAAVTDDVAHRVGEELGIEALEAVRHHGPQQGDQRQQGDEEGRGDESRHQAVDGLATALRDGGDHRDDHHVEQDADDDGARDVEVGERGVRAGGGDTEHRGGHDERDAEEGPRSPLRQAAGGEGGGARGGRSA
ncbi:unnamed protein product, partial [Penicillium discolor]